MGLSKPSTAPHGKSALSRVVRTTSALLKTTITADFSDMSKWVVLSGTPEILSGSLSGRTAVRYVDELASDNYRVTATIGAVLPGRTWLVTSANPNFDRFYAVELNTGGLACFWSIIHGTGVVATTSTGLFGIISGIIGFVLGQFEDIIAALFGQAEIEGVAEAGHTVTVWWDEPNSRVRAYYDDDEVTSMAVPRYELQHVPGFRYFGIVSGIDGPILDGVMFNSVTAQDV
jgi:hypothetical protein